MLIHDRIQLIMKANQLTASSFADEIGIKRSNLSHVLSGRNKPSLDFLAKIITHFPNVNASWLITGDVREGEFKATDAAGAVPQIAPEGEIDQIVVFFQDGTFKRYRANEQ